MKMKKFIYIISIFLILIIVLSPAISAKERTPWEIYLKDLLVIKFPHIFDEEVKMKNNIVFEEYLKWVYSDTRKPYDVIPSISPEDVSSDIFFGPSIFYPAYCEFYDMDFDKIPEAVIIYVPLIAHGAAWGDVYKLYGTSYEYIGTLGYHEHREQLHVDSQNNLISVSMDSIKLIEITDKKLKRSENNLIEYYKYDGWISYGAIEEDFQILPQFDCADIINEITNININSPQTSDNSAMFYLFSLITMIQVLIIIKRIK